ncbi:Uncharacterised protein [Delftia tsuruhatensis]|uniref:hypothetical protein n=1 Tax=Delftia tsuruhatensis TaxID=180282 RepID=UPI001E7B2E28|nr:hypothetical protein [Delftia tsuruhatensis]CAB5709139.1 Uncharacterised protein [Delftia tsuruhatensis]CAC9685414.1 Uncharacterised protein [Delftia tsuruhatensis]
MTDIVSPTPITELPPAPQPTDTPAEFNTKGFATVAAQVAMIPQINTANAQTFQNATAANERATAAGLSAGQSQGFRNEAEGFRNTTLGYRDQTLTFRNDAEGFSNTAKNYRDQTQGFRNEAEGFRNTTLGYRDQTLTFRNDTEGFRSQAQDFRNQAEVFATQQIKGSSSTSVTPGAGAKSFVIEPSRSFVTGMYVVATSTSDPATQMSGPVQSYNPATGALVIAVDVFAGSAARSDWVIGVAAPGAATGLARQVVTTNTTCVAGVAYIVAAAGITLTLPATWVPGDRIAIIEAIGDGAQYSIAFGGTKLRSRSMGTQVISAVYGATGVLTHQDATRGIV